MKKTIFITGASTGLGKATAQLFASRNWNVIATMRNPENDTELSKLENVTLLTLDVTKPEQIEAAVRQATALHKVDVLFNNAGYGLVGPLEGLSNEQIYRQFATNLLGVLFVTQAFLPHLRTTGGGLIITTTSIGGLVSFPMGSTYHATKWALEGWAESMSFELALHNIGIKTVSPGVITTDFMGRSLDMKNHEAYQPLMDKLMSSFDETNMANASSAEQIAEIVYEAATDGKDQLRYLAGEDAKAFYAQRLSMGSEEFRKMMGKQFQV